MDESKEEIEYKMYPNDNNGLTEEAARDVRKIAAQIEREVNDILEEDYEETQKHTR